MFETFFSLVATVSRSDDEQSVTRFLEAVRREIATAFADYEVILVDNGSGLDLHSLDLDEDIRSNCYIVRLAHTAYWDHAVLAGLERANGDYSACFEVGLADQLGIVRTMYCTALEGNDIVGLRDRRRSHVKKSIGRALFFWTLRMSGTGRLDPKDRREILVSRRALNWIVRDRAVYWYLNDALISSGFKFRALEVDLPTLTSPRTGSAASDQAWSALLRSSHFLGLFGRAIIGGLLSVLVLVTLNTLMVRFLGRDILWQTQAAVPGWTYTVLLLSAGFSALAMLLYVVLRVQLILLEEVRSRPRYVVENFGRI